MAGVYTEETLRALNKNQIIDLFLKTQEQTNTTIASLTAEIKRLNENFQKLESNVSVIKNVNNILSKQMSSFERQCWKNAQYSRHECVEVVGLPLSVEDKELEPTFCRMLQHIGVDIMEERFEACHLLSKQSDRTIFKFQRRKDCEHAIRKKSELRKLKLSELDLPKGTKPYINESLCPYYRSLQNQCKKLWNKQGIFSFFTVNGSIKIKLRKNGYYNIITHIDDLKDFFPDKDFTLLEAAFRRSSVKSCSCSFSCLEMSCFTGIFSRGSISLGNYYACALLRNNFF